MASLLLRISSVQKYMISMSILVRPFLNNILYERTGNFLCLLQITIFWLSPMSDSSIAHYSCHSKYSYCFTLQTYFWCCIPSSRSSGTVLTQNFFNVFLSSVSRYRFPLKALKVWMWCGLMIETENQPVLDVYHIIQSLILESRQLLI